MKRIKTGTDYQSLSSDSQVQSISCDEYTIDLMVINRNNFLVKVGDIELPAKSVLKIWCNEGECLEETYKINFFGNTGQLKAVQRKYK